MNAMAMNTLATTAHPIRIPPEHGECIQAFLHDYEINAELAFAPDESCFVSCRSRDDQLSVRAILGLMGHVA